MATQSSAAVFCRAVVMLACLVAIPLVAVSGGSLPPQIKGLVAEYWPSAVPAPASPGLEPGEPPRFQPTAAAAISPIPVLGGWDDPSQQSPQDPGQFAFRSVPASSPGSVVPVGFDAPAYVQPLATPTASQAAEPPLLAVAGQEVAGQPIGPGRPVRPSSLRQTAPPSDPFTAMQARLQELGATYVLLESMGNRQEVYRCYCRMAIGGDPSYAYYFEAVDSAPLEAMAEVVRQVEQWRSGRP